MLVCDVESEPNASLPNELGLTTENSQPRFLKNKTEAFFLLLANSAKKTHKNIIISTPKMFSSKLKASRSSIARFYATNTFFVRTVY